MKSPNKDKQRKEKKVVWRIYKNYLLVTNWYKDFTQSTAIPL